jgi:hypothetical protein
MAGAPDPEADVKAQRTPDLLMSIGSPSVEGFGLYGVGVYSTIQSKGEGRSRAVAATSFFFEKRTYGDQEPA